MNLIPDFHKCKVVVVGDVMLDIYYWGEVKRISPEAPVPVVRVDYKTNKLGGAANVALNLVKLGCSCSLVGIRGKDLLGELLVRKLNEKGIDTCLVRSKDHITTSKTRIIGRGQQLVRLDDETVKKPDHLATDSLFKYFCRAAEKADAVIISDYGKAVFGGELAQRIIRHCRLKNIPVMVDPKGNDWQRYRGASCITPNWSEFIQAAEHYQLGGQMKAIAEGLLDTLDLDFLLVTRGAKGMALFSREGKSVSIHARAREVFDVSGAGDTVIATLAAGRAAGCDMQTAAAMANAAAGVVVGKLGTNPVSADELEQALVTDDLVGGGKIKNMEQACAAIADWKSRGKKIVFTNGCFDLLHVGHVRLLEEAAAKGDVLVVGVNSDESVRRLKGPSRPIIGQDQRAALLAGIKAVDLVVIFEEDTPIDLIRHFKPHVLVKGGDYTVDTVVGHELVKSWGGNIELVPLVGGVSTSQVIASVRAKCG